MDAPPDRYKFVYSIFILHGIGTLLPWNMFITATDESVQGPAADLLTNLLKGPTKHKYNPSLRSFALTLPQPVTISKWFKCIDGSPGFTKEALTALKIKQVQSDYPVLCNLVMDEMAIRKQYFIGYKLAEENVGYVYPHVSNFMQYLTFTSTFPALVFNYINIFVQLRGNLTTRIIWSMAVVIVLFIFTIILAMIDTSGSPHFFFWVTMLSAVILNMSNGIYQNSVFGLAAKLPGKYTGGIILGNNISGLFVSIVSLISAVVSSSTRMAAIYYFITALFVLFVGVDTIFALPLNKYYRYYDIKHELEQDNQKKRQVSAGQAERPPYLYILKKCMMQCVNIFTVYLVTLSIFPALQAGVRRTNPDFFIPDSYFTAITAFISFNLFAMLGSLLPFLVIWPGPKLLCVPVFLRLIFIPLFLLCNYQVEYKERTMAVLIGNEWLYWIFGVIFAFTSGYFSCLAMMYAPRTVEEEHATVAGMFAGAALMTGIVSGVLLTFLWPYIVTY